MPFYEYECSACKFYVEALQKISDPPLVKCPSCGKSSLQRLVSAPNFRLKGSGWYETDFKSDKESKRNIAGGEDKPAESKDSDSADSSKAQPKSKSKSKRPVRGDFSNRSQKGELLASKARSSRKKKAKKAAKKNTKNKARKPAKKRAVKKASRKK